MATQGWAFVWGAWNPRIRNNGLLRRLPKVDLFHISTTYVETGPLYPLWRHQNAGERGARQYVTSAGTAAKEAVIITFRTLAVSKSEPFVPLPAFQSFWSGKFTLSTQVIRTYLIKIVHLSVCWQKGWVERKRARATSPRARYFLIMDTQREPQPLRMRQVSAIKGARKWSERNVERCSYR